MAPQHVFITDEPITGKLNGIASFRGLQPKARGDVIFISKDGDSTTPIHESIHAQFGFEELATVPLTRIMHRKVQFIRRFPMLAKILRKPVKYREVEASTEFPQAHGEKYASRVRHYILVR